MTPPNPDPTSGAAPGVPPDEQATQAFTPGGRAGKGGTAPPEDLAGDPALHGCSTVNHNGRRTPSVGRIALIRRLGRGGMGVVYYGVHPRLHMEVAVKVLPRGSEFKDDGLLDRFVREARLAARVRSEHLVSVIDVDCDSDSGVNYLVMEYVHGTSAGDHLRRTIRDEKRQIAEADALDICIAATRGLQAAHLEGIVHRDVKPDNILIPRDQDGTLRFDHAKLADLGLARTDDGQGGITQTQATLGTPGYMAPEQVTDARRAKKAADVFSIGATLYALLTGVSPFSGSTSMEAILRTLEGKYPHPRTLRQGISDGSLAVMAKCLDRDPTRRFADASSLLAALVLARSALAASGKAMPDLTAEIEVIAKQSEKGKRVVTDAGAGPDEGPSVSVSVTLQAPPSQGGASGHDPVSRDAGPAAPTTRGRRMLLAAGAAVVCVVAAFGVWSANRENKEPGRPAGAVGSSPSVRPESPHGAGTVDPVPSPPPQTPPGTTPDGAAQPPIPPVAPAGASPIAAPPVAVRRVRFDSQPGVVVRADAQVLAPGDELPRGTDFVICERPDHASQKFPVNRDGVGDMVISIADWRDFRAALDLTAHVGSPGVRVVVDGRSVAAAMVLFPAAGRHVVEFIRDEKERARFDADVRVGRDDWRPPPVLPWAPIVGTVSLPAAEGVTWYLADGTELRRGASLPVNTYTLVLRRPGYVDGAGRVVVTADADATAEVVRAPERIPMSLAEARDALSTIAKWDALSPSLQQEAAETIGRTDVSLEFLGTATFTLAGQSHHIATFRHKPSALELSLVPGGAFRHVGDHQVLLSPFLVARYEVTNADWRRVMGTDAPTSKWTGPANPKESISWFDAVAFCRTAKLELPTEAQWEHASRAGSTSTWITGDSQRDVALAARYNLEAADPTGPVPAGSRPNAFGLFDTMGNVAEWCQDAWSEDPAIAPAPATGLRVVQSPSRAVRGGSAYSGPDVLASGHRHKVAESKAPRDTGFRPVLNLP